MQDVESFLPPDSRLDHGLLQARVSCDTLGPMPPLEALRTPVRLRMRKWQEKKVEWQAAVTQSLARSAPEVDPFRELERIKESALECARAVLGTTGGRLLRILPHHSKEDNRLKARLTLLRMVQRELYVRQDHADRIVPPSRAMRKAWDAGLIPQPADFSLLTGVWLPQNQSWTEEWLRFL